MAFPRPTIPLPPPMRNFSDEDLEAARTDIIRDLLARPRLEASAYPTLNHEDRLQVFLEDVDDKHWPVFLAVIVDVPDLTAAVQAHLTEHFNGHPIPPLTVVRR